MAKVPTLGVKGREVGGLQAQTPNWVSYVWRAATPTQGRLDFVYLATGP